jgi:transcriptional regulator with XRE-family HTH domain
MLGERIKSLRKQKGYSQAELGKLVGLSYAQIGRYETKGMQPSADALKKIADLLGVSPDYLLSGSAEDKAIANLDDKDLIKQFKEVEQMEDGDKNIVKRFLDAFITKIKLEQITS